MFKKLIPGLFLLIALWLGLGRSEEALNKNYIYLETWQMDKIENTAQELLAKKSLAAEEEWFLGLFYFYSGDYRKAIYYLKNAGGKNPQNKSWSNFYNFVAKTGQITKDFQTYESEHFILRLDKKDNILVNYALEALQKGYQEVGKELDYFPDRKVLVEIYPTSEDFNFTSSLSKRDMEVSGAIGICKFNRLMIVSPRCLAFGFRWLDALVHEYTHFVVNRKSNTRCPLWLHEGIARFEEKRWISSNRRNYLTPVSGSLLKEALDNNKMISFEKMSPSLVKLETHQDVALAFAEVASAVDYLVSDYGPEILSKLLEKLKENPDYEEVITAVSNKSYKKFEEDWLEFIKNMNLVITPGIILESFKIKDENVDYETEEYLNAQLRDYIRLGDMFKQRGKPEVALGQYQKVLRLQPYNPVVLNRLGKIYFALGNFVKAEESYKEAIKMNPDYVSSYTNLGDLYFYYKDSAGALTNYQESNRLNPFNPAIHKNMGLIYYQSDRQKAIEEWKVTAKLDPQDLEIQGWLMNLPEGK